MVTLDVTLCPGSGRLLDEDACIDGDVVTCPECKRNRTSTVIAPGAVRVDNHRALVSAARRAEMARDEAVDEVVDAHVEAREVVG